MTTSLVFLLIRTVRGRIIRALRLLKQPKYLIGIAVFVAWIVFWIGSPFIFNDDPEDVEVNFVNAQLVYETVGEALPAIQLLVALGLALLVSLWWLVPWSRLALNLTEAEIHMLTPMPIKRRHLIQYATLKAQPGILFGCLMMTIFLGSGGPLERLRWLALFWVMLTMWDLHSKGRSLWIERQKELPSGKAVRNRLLLAGAIVVYWLVLGTAVVDFGTRLIAAFDQLPADFEDTRASLGALRETLARFVPELQSGLIGRLLTPFVWVSAPLFLSAPGVSLAQKLTWGLIPLALLVVHNEWVVRSGAKFEEAALAHARREASKKEDGARYWKTSERSRRRAPFKLNPMGAPEVAILWKNSMMITRFSYKTLALFGAAVVGLALAMPVALSAYRGAAFVVLSIGLMTLLISPLTGAQSYRNDLRTDLLRVEMVRTWPIEGWKLFAAEAAGPALFATMSALLGAAIVLAMNFYMAVRGGFFGESFRIGPDSLPAALGVPLVLLLPLIIVSALPVLIALTCLAATIQNLMVLLFPGWVQLGKQQQQGAAAFGQNMVMFFGLTLASLLSLLPGALIVAAIVAIQWLGFGIRPLAWEWPIFGIIAATPVAAVAALVVRAGGRVWDNLDPSREVLQGIT